MTNLSEIKYKINTFMGDFYPAIVAYVAIVVALLYALHSGI